MSLLDKESYTFLDFRVDTGERLLFQNGERLPLTEKAFEVLCLLVREHGSLVTKDRFFDEIWHDCAVEGNNLDKCISLIRPTLGEEKSSPQFIETVRGHGYRFIASVKNSTSGYSHVSGTDSFSIPANSIAVLAFENLSTEKENEYFCEGLAEELLNSLSKIRNLKVAARTSAFSFKEKDVRISEIADILQVRTILEGSVRRSNDRLRIAVRLIDAPSGYLIWSENYDRAVQDIFDIQDEIALAVVDSLKVDWFSEERDAVLKRHTANTEAYFCYMKGQYYRWKGSGPEFAHSLKYLERSVEVDPSFALGYFGVSTYYGYGTAWGLIPINPSQGWALAESAIAKALEIDDSLVEAKLSLAAFSLVKYRKFTEAGAAIADIAAASPNFAEIHHLYSFYLLTIGKFNEAAAEARRALYLDPLSVLFSRMLAQCLYFARKYSEAISQLREALELDPNNYLTHSMMSEIYLKMGSTEEALVSWQMAARLEGGSQDQNAANLLEQNATLQKIMLAEAGKRLERLFEESRLVEYVPSIRFVRQYIVMNDKENAFEWLAKACDELNVFPLLIAGDPFYDGLRVDPRFDQLVKKVGCG